MVRLSFILLSVFVFALLLIQGARAQTATPMTSTSPTPARTVPSGAPSTGFGE